MNKTISDFQKALDMLIEIYMAYETDDSELQILLRPVIFKLSAAIDDLLL